MFLVGMVTRATNHVIVSYPTEPAINRRATVKTNVFQVVMVTLTKGWYGDTYESHCVDTCKKQYCDRSTSESMNGCDAGFMGLFCNMSTLVCFNLQ
jgi:hypothetical protein